MHQLPSNHYLLILDTYCFLCPSILPSLNSLSLLLSLIPSLSPSYTTSLNPALSESLPYHSLTTTQSITHSLTYPPTYPSPPFLLSCSIPTSTRIREQCHTKTQTIPRLHFISFPTPPAAIDQHLETIAQDQHTMHTKHHNFEAA